MESRVLSATNSKNSSNLQISFRAFTCVKKNGLPLWPCSREGASVNQISSAT